jgi:hypothetical protein
VEILHPLLELLQSPDPTLSGYAKRVVERNRPVVAACQRST